MAASLAPPSSAVKPLPSLSLVIAVSALLVAATALREPLFAWIGAGLAGGHSLSGSV